MGVSDSLDKILDMYHNAKGIDMSFTVSEKMVKDNQKALSNAFRTIDDGEDSNGSTWADPPSPVNVNQNDCVSMFIDSASEIFAHVQINFNYIIGYEHGTDYMPVVKQLANRALTAALSTATTLIQKIKHQNITTRSMMYEAFAIDKVVFVLEGPAPHMKAPIRTKRALADKLNTKTAVAVVTNMVKENANALISHATALFADAGFQHTRVFVVNANTEGEVAACYEPDPDCVLSDEEECSCNKGRVVISYDNDAVMCSALSKVIPRKHKYNIKAVGLRRHAGQKRAQDGNLLPKQTHYKFVLKPHVMVRELWAFWILRGCDYTPSMYSGKKLSDLVDSAGMFFKFMLEPGSDYKGIAASMNVTLNTFANSYIKSKCAKDSRKLVDLVLEDWIKDVIWLLEYWTGNSTVSMSRARATPLTLSELK